MFDKITIKGKIESIETSNGSKYRVGQRVFYSSAYSDTEFRVGIITEIFGNRYAIKKYYDEIILLSEKSIDHYMERARQIANV